MFVIPLNKVWQTACKAPTMPSALTLCNTEVLGFSPYRSDSSPLWLSPLLLVAVLLRKQESGDGMRSMELPYVGEDEVLSWCSAEDKSEKKRKKNTPQHEAPLLTDFHGWLVAPPFLSLSLLGDEADAEKTWEFRMECTLATTVKVFSPFLLCVGLPLKTELSTVGFYYTLKSVSSAYSP